jgi:hypothetical protein
VLGAGFGVTGLGLLVPVPISPSDLRKSLREERRGERGEGETYHALQIADQHPRQRLAGLVAVADILERFCGVLAADVQEDFFAAAGVD